METIFILKDCPFCGGKVDKISKTSGGYQAQPVFSVVCKCGASMSRATSLAAQDKWNKRV